MDSASTSATSNYKDTLKGTSLFGGVQIYKIVISVLRSKVLAVFLGPVGVGVLGLLNSTIDFIYGLTNFGLNTSAVREISIANKESNQSRLSYVVSVFKKLVWITGLLGLAVCLLLSPFWSNVSFSNYDYTLAYAILSIAVLSRLLSEGQNTLLQGTHNLRLMAKSNVWGNTFGLLVVPIYYFWGISGIAPALLLTYVVNLLVSWYYSNKVKIQKISVPLKEALREGRSMVKLGALVALSGLLSTGVSYLIRIYIGKEGGLSDVGLFTAGFAIVNTYVGMVFTAMATEYFPRLSSISKDQKSFNLALNQQMQVCILLIAPLICAFLIFSKVAVIVLYSNEFLGIERMILFAIFAILFKAPSWCCSYAILAKGDFTVFFWTEVASMVVMLALNIILYALLGLDGLGIAYIVLYIYYLIQEWIVCTKRYGISLDKGVIKTYLPHFILCGACLLTVFVCQNMVVRYSLGSLLIGFDLLISYKDLNSKVNIREWLLSRKNK